MNDETQRIDAYAVLVGVDGEEMSERVTCTVISYGGSFSIEETPLYIEATANGEATLALFKRDTDEQMATMLLGRGLTIGEVVKFT
jgi:hypothetical protein